MTTCSLRSCLGAIDGGTARVEAAVAALQPLARSRGAESKVVWATCNTTPSAEAAASGKVDATGGGVNVTFHRACWTALLNAKGSLRGIDRSNLAHVRVYLLLLLLLLFLPSYRPYIDCHIIYSVPYNSRVCGARAAAKRTLPFSHERVSVDFAIHANVVQLCKHNTMHIYASKHP